MVKCLLPLPAATSGPKNKQPNHRKSQHRKTLRPKIKQDLNKLRKIKLPKDWRMMKKQNKWKLLQPNKLLMLKPNLRIINELLK